MDEYADIPKGVSLEVIEGADTSATFNIANKTITIGRADASDLKLSDEYVSNKHCQIVFRDDHFTVIDLQSLNKTKVNDNVFQQRNLDDGDILSLGKTKIKFRWVKLDM
ncbi:MAG: FHA domain-containing protein [Spirochaetes bacterium]|nr:FHA domain-containing protein [Spirochaetota bacterium]